jgi:hypothetical protein
VTNEFIDLAAAELRVDSAAFTQRGLYHAVQRRRAAAGDTRPVTFTAFSEGPLARRLRWAPIPGLLQGSSLRGRSRRLPAEWRAYFPAAILLVDRPEIVELFAASGALVQARIAVVCIDGSPSTVINWLRSGLRAGHRAPVGYLHDARTVVYPYLFEPLATFLAMPSKDLVYKDLGIRPGLGLWDPLGIANSYSRQATELDEMPPCSLVAYAATELLAMVVADPLLAPLNVDFTLGERGALTSKPNERATDDKWRLGTFARKQPSNQP